jgi:hypothetical protein
MSENPKRRTMLQAIGSAGVGYSVAGTEATATDGNSPPRVSKDDSFDSSIVVSNSDREKRIVTVKIVAEDESGKSRRVFSRSYQLDSKGDGKGIPASKIQGVTREPLELSFGDESHYRITAKVGNGLSASSDVVVPSTKLPRNRLFHVRIREGTPSISVSKT